MGNKPYYGDEDTVWTLTDKGRELAEQIEANKENIVSFPSHYVSGGIETIDFIEAKELNFRLANVVKYVSRAGKKSDNRLQDLMKAQWYLDREINKCQ